MYVSEQQYSILLITKDIQISSLIYLLLLSEAEISNDLRLVLVGLSGLEKSVA